MEQNRILRWLREHGVTSLHGKTWTITERHLSGRQSVLLAHADPTCGHIGTSETRAVRRAELEELCSDESEPTMICLCVYNELGENHGEKIHLNASRIRISMERLDSLLADSKIDEEGRWPTMKAAAILAAAKSAREQRRREPEPALLTAAADAAAGLWDEAVAKNPIDWERFDQELIERSAIGLTRREIWEEITFIEHQQWQDDQSIAGHWMGLGWPLTETAQRLIDEEHPDVKAKFDRWDALLAANLADTKPRAIYAGTIERDPSASLPALRYLIMHRGLRTDLKGKYAGFVVLPNVVARTLAIREFWGDDGRVSSGATLLETGLPDLSDLGWETALLLWEESFSDRENPGPYREFTAAIEAAAAL